MSLHTAWKEKLSVSGRVLKVKGKEVTKLFDLAFLNIKEEEKWFLQNIVVFSKIFLLKFLL